VVRREPWTAAVFRGLPGLAIAWALTLSVLPGCDNTRVHNINVQTAASGTRIEARQVVALVYQQAPDGEIDKLLYSGGDTTTAIRQVRDHHSRIRSWLDQGVIGNTATGFVALRETARAAELHDLLWDENRYRAFLYNRAAKEVGHGGDTLASWLPYASYSFGQEWISQGSADWWVLDESGTWRRAADQERK